MRASDDVWAEAALEPEGHFLPTSEAGLVDDSSPATRWIEISGKDLVAHHDAIAHEPGTASAGEVEVPREWSTSGSNLWQVPYTEELEDKLKTLGVVYNVCHRGA